MKYIILVSLLLFITSCSFNQNIQGNVVSQENLEKINTTEQAYLVTNVIDGDTFKIQNNQKVRLIGINAPEKDEKYYKEATQYLTNLILNQRVILERDISETDRFGRLLRYVYLENGTFINLEMIKNGHAAAKSFKPDIKYDHLFRSTSNPTDNCINLGCPKDTQLVGNKKSLVYHYCYCTYADRISKENLICFNSVDEAQEYGYKETKIC